MSCFFIYFDSCCLTRNHTHLLINLYLSQGSFVLLQFFMKWHSIVIRRPAQAALENVNVRAG